MATLDSEGRQDYLASLRAELGEVKQIYENLDNDTGKETEINLRCTLWVLDGALNHNIDRLALEQVAKKYGNLGLVPQGYQQPDLFMRDKPTRNDQLLASLLSFERI